MHLDRLKSFRLHGVSKFFHTVFMVVTYPLRHWFRFLIFVFILVVIAGAVPMSQGIRWNEIPGWYVRLFAQTREQLPDFGLSSDQEKPAEKFHFKEVAAPAIIHKRSEKASDNYWPEPEPRAEKAPTVRRAFTHAPKMGQRMGMRAQSDEAQIRPVIRSRTQKQTDSAVKFRTAPKLKTSATANVQPEKPKASYYRKDPNLPLVYEDEPAEIKGAVMVFSANDLTVGDYYLYLYGIYTDPKKYDAEKARRYLEELTAGKVVNCKIVAYTHQNIATGVCFLNGRSINRNLVDAGFADNIAL